MASADSVEAFVALGSNLGDRAAHLQFGFDALAALPDTQLRRRSRIYESVAVGPGAQGPYLNAVAALATTLAARPLLDALLAIEARAGRVRHERWGPRTLDLDLLLYGEERIDAPGLAVPHPRMLERVFVLLPLSEVLGPRLLEGESASARAARLDAASESPSAWIWEGK